ncbi:uncharacterized protein ALTATR162_LOCUS10321 [Alternaria atra]|uniref:Peptidase A1 domain-containing protein n=1 Tax=Alternaria atra TaxID=119953 RepID=A0A8J2N9Q2_9PLEO|nr:uncharacterized protein ALTATR162_LOCUS10321 [Alternaria atra]CAG5182760.1 unnamed protein product [Alternaria atra]
MSNLKRISIIPNPACERAGMKQYASILKKYDFAPTTEGLFQMVDIATKNLKNLFKPTDKKATKPLLRKVEDDKPGEVKAEDRQNDALYICPVEIGTPSQIMNLHFDTGSSDIWMWSTELDRETKEARVKRSTASGIVGIDDVILGSLCVEGQAIELASKLSPQFTSGAGDGLLSLAFGHINTVKPKKAATFVEQVSLLPFPLLSLLQTPKSSHHHTPTRWFSNLTYPLLKNSAPATSAPDATKTTSTTAKPSTHPVISTKKSSPAMVSQNRITPLSTLQKASGNSPLQPLLSTARLFKDRQATP